MKRYTAVAIMIKVNALAAQRFIMKQHAIVYKTNLIYVFINIEDRFSFSSLPVHSFCRRSKITKSGFNKIALLFENQRNDTKSSLFV